MADRELKELSWSLNFVSAVEGRLLENRVFVSVSPMLQKDHGCLLAAFLAFLWFPTPSPLKQGRTYLYLGQSLRRGRHPVIMGRVNE